MLNSHGLVNHSNVIALQKAMQSGKLTGNFLPAIYAIEPTNKCNLKCIMCPNSRLDDDMRGDIDLLSWSLILNEISPVAELVMLYFNGEPTLHPRWDELLRQARKILHGKIVVSTNGFNLSNHCIEAIVDNADIVLICLDRWNSEAYENIRLGSNFNKVVESAKLLLTARGARQLPIIITKTLDIAFNGESRQQLELEESNFKDYWTKLGAVAFSGWLDTWAGQISGLSSLLTMNTPYSDVNRSACADLWFKMVINWNCDVVLCCHDWKYLHKLGRLSKGKLKEIWHSNALISIRREHARSNFNCSHICPNCKEWSTPQELESYLRLSTKDIYSVF